MVTKNPDQRERRNMARNATATNLPRQMPGRRLGVNLMAGSTLSSVIATGIVALSGLGALLAPGPLLRAETGLAEPRVEQTRANIQAPEAIGKRASAVAPASPNLAHAQTNGTKRGFLMGFTSWPYAATFEAVRGTYAFIGTNADLIVEHMDDGVPWAESLRDAPFPKAFLEKIEGRRKNRPPGMKLLLSLTPLNLGHTGLAECASNGQRPPLPVELKGKPFDDPQVIRAYLNYCRRMAEFFQPDFLVTGIESNELLNNQPRQWDAYLELGRQVRHELHQRFPRLPLSESITLHKLRDRQNPKLAEYRAKIQAFVQTHDFFAVSFYPFFLGLHTEKEFAEALDDLPTFSAKPIAIAETGHPAEPIKIRTWKLDFPSDAAEQAAFVRALLSRAQAHHYLFVTYWTARDFDELWKTFPESVKDLGALWRDTGLINEAGRPRPAYETWKLWLAKPRE
jgi:Glycosyl hydrolase family 53